MREWARILGHPAHELLTTRLFWRKTVHQTREGAAGIGAKEHYEALQLARNIPGLELLDGDARAEIQPTPITGGGFQRLRWRRYEIESYLIHPAALERFVEAAIGPGDHSAPAKADLRAYLEQTFKAEFMQDPLNPGLLVENLFRTTKARTELLPPILTAAGLPGFAPTRYHEIAAVMLLDEVHPEVREKLDGIVRAFGL